MTGIAGAGHAGAARVRRDVVAVAVAVVVEEVTNLGLGRARLTELAAGAADTGAVTADARSLGHTGLRLIVLVGVAVAVVVAAVARGVGGSRRALDAAVGLDA